MLVPQNHHPDSMVKVTLDSRCNLGRQHSQQSTRHRAGGSASGLPLAAQHEEMKTGVLGLPSHRTLLISELPVQ